MTDTDWEKRLKQRRATIKRAEKALEEDITDAYDQGKLSWRKIGAAAEVNHEWARQRAEEVRKRRASEHAPPIDAESVANPGRTQVNE